MWVASSRALGRRRWALRVDAGEVWSFPRKQTTKEGSSMRARAWMKGKGSCVLTVSLLLSLLLWPAQSAAQSANTTFSGQATVVRATVAGITTVISDTGPLPSSGGAQEATLLTANAPGLLTAEALHASTVGQEQHSRAEASVANLNLTVGGITISAEFLMAKATATCDNNGGSSVSGSSD